MEILLGRCRGLRASFTGAAVCLCHNTHQVWKSWEETREAKGHVVSHFTAHDVDVSQLRRVLVTSISKPRSRTLLFMYRTGRCGFGAVLSDSLNFQEVSRLGTYLRVKHSLLPDAVTPGTAFPGTSSFAT
jgi:hypothetical protein